MPVPVVAPIRSSAGGAPNKVRHQSEVVSELKRPETAELTPEKSHHTGAHEDLGGLRGAAGPFTSIRATRKSKIVRRVCALSSVVALEQVGVAAAALRKVTIRTRRKASLR